MPLTSELFKGNARLQSCLVSDPSHVTEGQSGDHVELIQTALQAIDNAAIDPEELKSKTYGKSTASAVLAYKAKRKIINRSYQSTPDNIVGKMTIASLDRDMLEQQKTSPNRKRCSGFRLEVRTRNSATSIPEKVPLRIAAIWDAHDRKNRLA